LRGQFRAGQDGPGVEDALALSQGKPPADGHPEGGREQRIEAVVEAVPEQVES
jgi:hypothetical protein